MKTREYIDKIQANRWVRTIALGFAAFIVFSYMYTRGISPVWAAVAIVCFRGFFRFLYRIAAFWWLRPYFSAYSVFWYPDNI